MAKTVEQILTGANDSVTLINQINDGDFSYFQEGYTQEVVNRRVQENIDYLEHVLAMSPIDDDDPTPDVVGDSSDKTPYTTAIATGRAYIEENS